MKILGVSLVAGLLVVASTSVLKASAMKGPWIKPDTKAQKIYDQMADSFNGEWKLSPEEKQIDTTGAHNSVKEFLGKDLPMTSYMIKGKGTTLQEEMLTGTKKEMVTMYHCNRRDTCEILLATHYCAKRNQPRLVLNLDETTETKFVFDCDMGSSLCQSNEDHIHKITHEFGEDGKHLKSSYLGMKDQQWNKKNSIFHYDKR